MFESRTGINSSDVIKMTQYNDNNTLINNDNLIKIFKKGGIDRKPMSVKIYQQSFIHKSYVKKKNYNNKKSMEYDICPSNCLNLFDNSNERLEFLGDSIIDSVVVSYLYRRFEDQDEGFMTKLKTRLVKTDALASFSNYIGLSEHLIISKHVEDKCDGRINPRILEDLFEAFIGAMFLDFSEMKIKELNSLIYGPGYSICETFIINLLEGRVDFETLILNDENYKDILLRNYQQLYGLTPKYIELQSEGPAHQRTFTMGVLNDKGEIIGKGNERSKKKAEQAASKQALEYLNIMH